MWKGFKQKKHLFCLNPFSMDKSIITKKEITSLFKIFVMKKYFSIELSKGETIALVLIMGWIVASFFVPLPHVNSLGA